MILFVLKFIQFIVCETTKDRMTTALFREYERNSEFAGCISGEKGLYLSWYVPLTEQNACINGDCLIYYVETTRKPGLGFVSQTERMVCHYLRGTQVEGKG